MIWSVRVLRNLKPGQKLRYYRGNFPADIKAAQALDADTHFYASTLRSVQAEAVSLAGAGRVTPVEEPVQVMQPNGLSATLTDYIAIGTVPSEAAA